MNHSKYRVSGGKIPGYFLVGVSVIMLCKSLMLCFSNDIWYDELFTVGMIKHSYGDLIALTARDVHPPLYYCIVKLIVDLCKLISNQANPVITAKIVSVLPYFILLLYSMTLVRKRFGIFAGGLFSFCVAAMPQLSSYTVEIRMYSFALLFVTAAFLHAHETVLSTNNKAKLHGACLVGYGLAASYTQYFACVAVVMIYLYVLAVFWMKDRCRIKQWFLWVAVSVAGYAPWLFVLYNQITAVRESYWILPLTWRSLGGCVKFLMKSAFTSPVLSVILAVALFIVYTVFFLYEMIKLCHYSREKLKITVNYMNTGFALAGAGVLAGLVLFGFVASFLLRPIFVYRYMLPAVGCFWLGFAVGMSEMWQEEGKCCQIFCTVAAGLILLVGLRDYRAFMGEEEYKAVLMEQTGAVLSSIAPQDIVLYNFDQVQAVTSYYLDDDMNSYLWCGTPETLIQEIVRPYGSIEDIEAVKTWCSEGRNVWFLGSFNSREEIVEEWRTAGLKVEETGSYLLERYWFNLYKISL